MSLVLRTIHSPEQKTESAKNGLNSMSKPFFHNPSVCNKLHPPSHLSVRSVLLHFVQRSPPETRTLCKRGKKVYLFYSARFSHFIDSLNYHSSFIKLIRSEKGSSLPIIIWSIKLISTL